MLLYLSSPSSAIAAHSDFSLFESLCRSLPDTDIKFTSLINGHIISTDRDREAPALGAGISKEIQLAYNSIARYRPEVIIASGTVLPMLAGRLLGVETIYLADQLPEQGSLGSEFLAFALRIIVHDCLAQQPLAAAFRSKTLYAGPVWWERSAPQQLVAAFCNVNHILQEDSVIACVINDFPDACLAEVLEMLCGAIFALPRPTKCLVCCAEPAAALVERRIAGLAGFRTISGRHDTYLALERADLYISGSSRIVAMEAFAKRKPSISLNMSMGVRDSLLLRLPSHLSLNLRALDSALLAQKIEQLLKGGQLPRPYTGLDQNRNGELTLRYLKDSLP